MNDVSIELLEKIKELFNLNYDQSKKVESALKLLEKGRATYADAQDYAIEVGEMLADALGIITTDKLPNGKMYYNIAQKILEPTLTNNYTLISDYSKQVQSNLNQSANIGLKSIPSELNQDRIHGIAWKVSQSDNFDDVKWLLNDPIIQFSQSVVDDTIQSNANLHYRTGRSPVIKRKVMGHACEWCMNLAGTYSYPDVPDNVYQRHRDCRCQVTYDPKDGSRKVRNVHSGRWYESTKNDILSIERTSNNETAYPLKSVPERFQRYVPDKATRERIIEESLKLEKPIFMDDIVGKYAQYIQPKDGMYDVVLHGNKYFVEYFGKRIDPDTLCAMIAQRSDYEKNQPIRLISCNTGAVSDGVADYVSNKLHVKVQAPTTTAYVYPPKNGVSEVFAETRQGARNGEFVEFDGMVKKDG